MADPSADAATPRYVLLDMGREKFGDSILCRIAGRTILVDGGHPGDFDGQEGSDPLPDQIGAILKKPPPYKIDLLVVTHAHLDHIGCLPRMVKEGVLDVAWALVADERLGWGKRIGDSDTSVLPDDPQAARLVAALREEPRADDFESDAAIARFLEDAVTLEQTYKTMLQTLTDRGTKMVRYGRDPVGDLETEFKSTGLKILGPTDAHLEICRRAIASSMKDAAADAMRLVAGDAVRSDVEMYRRLAAAAAAEDATADGDRLGAALNDQSILLAFGPAKNRALLTADMQFADPGVSGLGDAMTELRRTVAAAGPYKFIKLAHHGSHNGIDPEVRAEWAGTRLFAISGGSNDQTHPAREVLKLLKKETGISWARTDKNGRIEVQPASASKPLQIAKGTLNNASANPKPPKPEDVVVTGPVTVVPGGAPGVIEITARIPTSLRRVVITVESEPAGLQPRPPDPRPPLPGPSVVTPAPRSRGLSPRDLPPLLFVSNRKMLRENIGNSEADAAIASIEASGQAYLDVADPAQAIDAVRARLTDRHHGVVLIGGYDILPSQRLDTLPPEVRDALADQTVDDADEFIVWSDSVYGDRDQDDMPEVPVSRIPDGKSGELVLQALGAAAVTLDTGQFSIYNAKRPFAADIVDLLPGTTPALVSLPSTGDDVDAGAAGVPLVYFMLHGLDHDGTRFVGQEPEYPEAFSVDQVPGAGGGVVFTGCCWGALTVRQIASRVQPGRAITPRTSDQSIALRYLRAGYNAFVGCTGSHYSPPGNALSHGKPMHVAFWQKLLEGFPPAEALFRAKIQYLHDMPHGLDDIWDVAVEHKILRQFTCLGLGW